MILILKRRHILTFVACMAITLTAFLFVINPKDTPALNPISHSATVIVIDAGHGGEDGGAVSADGIAESHINLTIARRLELLFLFLGQDTIMTRTGEDAVYSTDADTLREKKVSDLKNRVALVNEQENAILLSIHQNSLPTHPGVHGAQVFYNTVAPGQALAESVQEVLNQTVNSGNEKAAKQIDGSVYLMKNSRVPSILVECGFMSHNGEVQLLQKQDYQLQMATCIVAGFRQYQINEG